MAIGQRTADHQPVVTSRMIGSGLQALKKWRHLPAGELLAAVYRAMAAQAPIEGGEPTKRETGETAEDILNRLAQGTRSPRRG